jgi:hypothetical protein
MLSKVAATVRAGLAVVVALSGAVAGWIAGRIAGGSTDRVERRRLHADREDGVVVFLIGMRINVFWKVHRWLPILLLGPRLVRGLEAEPESGLLGRWTFVSPPRTVGFVQYWDSFDDLRSYAREAGAGHVEAWQEYDGRAEEGTVGIWHETYRTDGYETVYNNVPPRGLGTAEGSDLVDASGPFESAAGRMTAEEHEA